MLSPIPRGQMKLEGRFDKFPNFWSISSNECFLQLQKETLPWDEHGQMLN